MQRKIIFIFLDGVGLGTGNESNPFYYCPTPHLDSILKDRLIFGHPRDEPPLLFKGIDACLGVEGVPQSATGQTTLFTGINAAEKIGFHFPAFPDETLKLIIDKHSIMKQVVNSGLRATFANAYTSMYFELVKQRKRCHSVTTLSVYAAGLPFRQLRELKKGKAVYWDITNDYMLSRNNPEVISIGIKRAEPEDAGRNLVSLTEDNELVVFECFMPDLLGHKRDRERAKSFIPILDSFISSVISNLDRKNTTLVITSDHGNMEDFSQGGHTKNPVPLICYGPDSRRFKSVTSIVEVPKVILDILYVKNLHSRLKASDL